MKIIPVILTLLTFASVTKNASAEFGFAVTTNSEIITFDLANPTTIYNTASITGLRQSNGVTPDLFGNLTNLAYNYNNGQFYGIDGNANFYSVNPTTGATTFISNSLNPSGFSAGLAYDPFATNLRFVTEDAENFSISTVGVGTAGPDVFYGVGDPNTATGPQFFTIAIDPDFGTGYAFDFNLDVLAQTTVPNFSEFFTIGGLGVDVVGFGGAVVLSDGSLLAALSTDAITSSLYSVNTTTGVATSVGNFATGINSVAVPEPATFPMLIGASAFTILIICRRKKNINHS